MDQKDKELLDKLRRWYLLLSTSGRNTKELVRQEIKRLIDALEHEK